MEGRDPNRVADHIKMLSERDVADLAATSSAVAAVSDAPLAKFGQGEDPTHPEVAPVDWFRAVLYICLEGKGRPVRVRSAAIYDHTGSSIRKAGITTLKTTVMAIRPGRYDPRTNRRRRTEYTPDTVAVQATVDWLNWHDDRDRRRQERVKASEVAEILSEVGPPDLADDAFLDCLMALAETLSLNAEELSDTAGGDGRLTYDIPISAVYDKMRDRHAEAVRNRGGILNIDTALFTVKRFIGGHQLTITCPEEMARVLEAVARAQRRLDAEQPLTKQPSLFDRLQIGSSSGSFSADSSSDSADWSLDDESDGGLLKKPLSNKTAAAHTTGNPRTAQGADSRAQPTTTTQTPKDSEYSSNTASKSGLEQSGRSSDTFAVGRKSGAKSLVEKDGIRFEDTWTIRSSQAEMIEQATRGLSDAAHHFFAHAVRSSTAQQKRSKGWFPFYHEHIRKTLPVSPEERDRTAMVWQPLIERGLIAYREHSSRYNRAREFRVDPEWLTRFLEQRFDKDTGREDSGSEDAQTVDAFTGQRIPLKKQQTRLYDSNRKKYSGSLLKGLRVLKSAVKRFDKAAVEAHLVRQKRKAEAARLKVRSKDTVGFNRHVQAYFDTSDAERKKEGWPTDVSLAYWKRIYPGERHTDAFLRHRRLRNTYLNDLRCYAAMIRQRPRHVHGDIWAYDTAWRVQAISGRVSEQGGALQSCSRPMKAAAFARLEREGLLYNYDLSSSQLRDIIDATERVSAIDTGLLRSRYLDTPKQENASELGISRDAYKSLLYMTGFMGGWKTTLENALRSAFQTIPEAVRIVRRAVREDGGDAETVYQAASKHFRPLKTAVRALADDLLGDYWATHKYNAGGYVMRNACARPFRKSDYVCTDDDGTIQTDDDGTSKYDRHEMRKRVLAWYLQGNEADKMHRLAARCAEEGIPVMGNEHDGLITGAPIPEALQQEVLPESPLEIKRFADYLREEEPPTDAELHRLRDDLNQWTGSDDAAT